MQIKIMKINSEGKLAIYCNLYSNALSKWINQQKELE